MEELSNSLSLYSFGEFSLNNETEQLFLRNEPVKIEPQLFNFLLLFLENQGQIVNRQQIQDSVWAGREVSDEAIRVALKKLRDILGDNAKAPKFIKTLPKQGYKWLIPTEYSSSIKDIKLGTRQTSLKIVSTVLILLCLILVMWFLLKNNITSVQKGRVDSSNYQVKLLTNMPGSEVFADFNETHNKIVFLHRETRESPQQLYVKYLSTGTIQRLSWDDANYANSRWSHDGKQLAFNRINKGKKTLHLISFDDSNNVKTVRVFDDSALRDKFVIGWMQAKSTLLLAEEMRPNAKHKIYAFNFEDKSLLALSSPNVSGRGDYAAAQSKDGRKLAILRETGKHASSLLILDAQTGNMLANKSLSFFPTKLVWHGDNDTVILSSFFGESSRYKTSTDFFEQLPKLPNNSLDVYASCGTRCYVLRQHNGNFLDIQETPLMFNQSEPSRDSGKAIINNGRLLRFDDAQDIPRYMGNGNDILYANLADQTLSIRILNEQNIHHQIAEFERSAKLTALTVAPNAKVVAGIESGRLFLIDVKANTTTPQFLTNALELVDNPRWHSNSRDLYLTSYEANKPSIILYNIKSKDRQLIIEDMVSFIPSNTGATAAIGVNKAGDVWVLKKDNERWRKHKLITSIPSTNIHHWKVIDHTLYYTQMVERNSQICRLALPNHDAQKNKVNCVNTGVNRFRLGFDIHPETKKLLLVESLSAESNIIRFTW